MLRSYEAYDKAESDRITGMDTAERRGIAIGEQRGIAIGEQQVLDLLRQGVNPADILARYGG